MLISSNRFSLPVLIEHLPQRSTLDEDIDSVAADIAIGKVDIDVEDSLFRIRKESVLAGTPADEKSPQLMSGGEVAYMVDDHQEGSLFLRKQGRPPVLIAPDVVVKSHVVSRDGSVLFLSDKNGWVRRWSKADGLGRPFFKTDGYTQLLGFSNDESRLLFTRSDKKHFQVLTWDLLDGGLGILYEDLHGSGSARCGAALSPSGKTLSVTRKGLLTSVDLEKGNTSVYLLHSELENSMNEHTVMAQLDDRFVLLADQRWKTLEDSIEEDDDIYDEEEIEVSDPVGDAVRENDYFYDEVRNFERSVIHMDYQIWDLKEGQRLWSQDSLEVGAIVSVGDIKSKEDPFCLPFPREGESHQLAASSISEKEKLPRRRLQKVKDWLD